jgi:DNA-binding GntR family transcriptional regulator
MGRKRIIPNDSKSPSVRHKAYQYIQRRITTGEMAAGTPISELSLAKELGSSRSPIREAISQLVAEGLLEQSVGGSILVVRLTRNDIADLCELREALETHALRKVARFGLMRENDKTHLRKLVSAIADLKQELVRSSDSTLSDSQMKRFITADLNFHTILIALSYNARINKIVNDTRLLMRIFSMPRRGHTTLELDRIHQHHQLLLEQISRCDVDATVKTITEYLQESQRERLEEFDQRMREESIRGSLAVLLEDSSDL